MTDEMDAVRALRDRGVNDPEALLQFGEPSQLLAACHRWDGQQGVSPGLLVAWIKRRQFPDDRPSPDARRSASRRRFTDAACRLPAGSIAESHHELALRCWPDDRVECIGDMRVMEWCWPLVSLECDGCGLVVAFGPRDLHLLAREPF